MKHANIKKSLLSKQTIKSIKSRNDARNSKSNNKEFNLKFLNLERDSDSYYLRNVFHSSRHNNLKSYHTNIQDIVDNNLQKILNHSQYDIIPFPHSNNPGKEKISLIMNSQTQIERNTNYIKEPLTSKKKKKNRSIISKLALRNLDTYYNELYQTNTISHSLNNSNKKMHKDSFISPTCSLPQTEANSQTKRYSNLKKISTKYMLGSDRLPMKQDRNNQIPIANYPKEHIDTQSIIKNSRLNRIQNQNNELSIIKNRQNSFMTSRHNKYKLKEDLKRIRNRLQKDINTLADNCIKNPNQHNDILDLENTKKSFYSKGIIEKIKIVNNFISTQSEDKFRGTRPRHRKIFVIIDGQIILTETKIDGAYIEIPTQRYFQFLETKKERMEKYYEFLAKCQKCFHKTLPFKNVFLLNGINVFDLNEISMTDKAVYVSMSTIFRGVHLFNQKTMLIKESDYDLLRFDEIKSKLKHKSDKKESIKEKIVQKLFLRKKTKTEEIPGIKVFKVIKKKRKYLEDQSFTFGKDDNDLEKEEYIYYSDNEKRCKPLEREFNLKYKTLIDQVLYLNSIDQKDKIEEIKRKELLKLKAKLATRVNEEEKEGLDTLIIGYNVTRGKKYNINMNHQKKLIENQDQEEEINEAARGMGIQLLRQLRIFREYKDTNIILDEKEFYKKELESDKIESIINRNIKRTYNITPLADRDIQRYYPDLVSFNIPRVLKIFPKLRRREFYEIFIQYKILLMICVCIGNNLKLITKGIDFDTFYYCNSAIKIQGSYMAQKIFNTFNVLDMKYINWEEFMKGMLKMKSKSLADKMDMFFKVIDADSNGLLSYEEVYNLSLTSLSRSFGIGEEDEIIQLLAQYFANLIFQLVELPVNESIPFALIKNKIIEGGSAASYFEMFICADTFAQ